MKILVLLALSALPAVAEPLFDLYSCHNREAQCQALFPGSAAQRESYTVNGREVVDGIDLGVSWFSEVSDGVRYMALFRRGNLVLGWEACCDADEDGHMVTWTLANGTATKEDGPWSGDGPGYLYADVNSSGHFIGTSRPNNIAVYDSYGMGLDLISNAAQWQDTLFNFGAWIDTEMLRINDAGHALVNIPYYNGTDFEQRLFVMAPIGVPVPGLTPVPEPSTALLLGLGVLLCHGAKCPSVRCLNRIRRQPAGCNRQRVEPVRSCGGGDQRDRRSSHADSLRG